MTTKKKNSFLSKTIKDAQRQQKAATSYGHLLLPKGVNVWSAKPGSKNVLLDFLPYEVTDPKHPDRDPESDIAVPGTLWYKRPYRTHRNIGVDNDTVVCLTSIKKPCPICEYKSKLTREGTTSKEDIKALSSSLRNLYVVVPLNDKEAEPVPHVFDISQFLFQDLLNEELGENPDNGVFPSLEEGMTLKVRFDATTIAGSKPFATADRIDFLDREEQWDETILKDVPNLDEVLKILSYDELKAKFFEMEEEEDAGDLKDVDEEEQEEKPVRRKRIVEEEEEEEKPKRGLQRSRPVKEEEEKSVSRMKRSSSSKQESDSSSNKCSFGHKFGIDTDEYKDCERCDVWDDCGDEKDKGKKR